MRSHTECVTVIDRAMATGNYGFAAYVEARCGRQHANLSEPPTPTEETR